MKEPTVLIANEGGKGRGHVALLAGVARAIGPGFRHVAAIPSLRYAAELAPLCAEVVAGPKLRYQDDARRDRSLAGNSTWGDYLAACGLIDEQVVRAHLRWWRRKIIAEDAAILIADYAPFAIWAARGLKSEGWDIEILSVGTGYGLPPSRLERFPVLLDDYRRSLHSEEAMLAVVNAVAAGEGLEPLSTLPAIAAADQELAFTLPYLDPYSTARAPDERFAPVLTPLPPVSDGTGTELFVYFAGNELASEALVGAIADLPMRRRGYVPGARPQTVARLQASGMVIEPSPVSIAEIARRSRLVLGSGQHGLMCLSALAGLPQIAVPTHLEQLLHCRRSEAQGVLKHVPFGPRTKGDIGEAILSAWCDAALAARAHSLSRDLRVDYPADAGKLLADRLQPVATRARMALR